MPEAAQSFRQITLQGVIRQPINSKQKSKRTTWLWDNRDTSAASMLPKLNAIRWLPGANDAARRRCCLASATCSQTFKPLPLNI
jgi:hypothetical protein